MYGLNLFTNAVPNALVPEYKPVSSPRPLVLAVAIMRKCWCGTTVRPPSSSNMNPLPSSNRCKTKPMSGLAASTSSSSSKQGCCIAIGMIPSTNSVTVFPSLSVRITSRPTSSPRVMSLSRLSLNTGNLRRAYTCSASVVLPVPVCPRNHGIRLFTTASNTGISVSGSNT